MSWLSDPRVLQAFVAAALALAALAFAVILRDRASMRATLEQIRNLPQTER